MLMLMLRVGAPLVARMAVAETMCTLTSDAR